MYFKFVIRREVLRTKKSFQSNINEIKFFLRLLINKNKIILFYIFCFKFKILFNVYKTPYKAIFYIIIFLKSNIKKSCIKFKFLNFKTKLIILKSIHGYAIAKVENKNESNTSQNEPSQSQMDISSQEAEAEHANEKTSTNSLKSAIKNLAKVRI